MWNIFSRSVFPLSNPKKISSMSISQLDSFAASVYAIANYCQIELSIIKFNRLERTFDFEVKKNVRYDSWTQQTYDDVESMILFVKYLYGIDTKNHFVKKFVQYGNEGKFSRLWNLITSDYISRSFKQIKKTGDLIYSFFKKIGIGGEYRKAVSYWDDLKN